MSQPSERYSGGAASHGRPRVLIVDDEASVRAAMMRYLARRGWDVCEAEDGEAAMRVLAPNVGASFTLVICDLRMPRFSGVEFYRWLLRARPDVIDRLVFSTGDTECVETAAFLGEVRRPVLAKPFELAELARIVDAASTSAQAA